MSVIRRKYYEFHEIADYIVYRRYPGDIPHPEITPPPRENTPKSNPWWVG